ncbi:hypothetical protein M2103_000585 [Ereboglobus sp. PH5-5]|nr:hypothetical protein [Ereboglobus sp. PH5-5]
MSGFLKPAHLPTPAVANARSHGAPRAGILNLRRNVSFFARIAPEKSRQDASLKFKKYIKNKNANEAALY